MISRLFWSPLITISKLLREKTNENLFHEIVFSFLKYNCNFFCLGYAASIQENAPSGTSVIRVTATDKDEGDLGIVSYELNHPAFTIGMYLIKI